MSRTKAIVETIKISVDQIRPSPYQPRLTFNLEDIRGSIQRDGILVPLTVRKKEVYYELIDGERRVRLARELGYKTVPCTVIDVDDETARRMVWKVNTLRQEYTPKEKAYYFKKLQEPRFGMSLRGIAREYDTHPQLVLAYLNVFKLPNEYQQMVWDRVIPIGVIQELEELFSGVQYCTPKNKPEIFGILDRVTREKRFGAMEVREAIRPYLAKLREEQISKAREFIEKVEPEVKVPETPEELERVARAFRVEAKKKREAALTPKEKARIEIEKKRLAEERERKKREKEEQFEEEVKKRAKQIEEAEKRRIEEEAKRKAVEELRRDTEFIKNVVMKEYSKMEPLKPADLGALEDITMRSFGAAIPPEKMDRAREIVKEEIRSIQKRLEIFPEKSLKMEPKFAKLEALMERGVIPYTIWDFQYRDDYAGDRDFHGNCSPQVVEQCIWRFTHEGDLVLDPMAGSGTAVDVCKRYNRKCTAYDIKPPKGRTDIIQNDSRKIPLEDKSVDMIFIHPPYWNLTYFTRAEEKLPDLSRARSVDEYLNMLRQVFKECHRVLKKGKFMCVLLGDLIREGKFIPLCREAVNMAEELGFIDYGYAMKLAHGEVSRKKSGVIVAEPIYTDNLKISHDLVMFFRKER